MPTNQTNFNMNVLSGAFADKLAASTLTPWSDRLIFKLNVNADSINLPWITTPGLTERTTEGADDDRGTSGKVSLVSKDFTDHFDIDVPHYVAGGESMFMPSVDLMVKNCKKHNNKVLCDLLKAGSSTAAHDGKNYFDATREGAENALTATVVNKTAPTTHEAALLMKQLWDAMLVFTNPSGLPVNDDMEAATLIAPAGIASAFREAKKDLIVGPSGVVLTSPASTLPVEVQAVPASWLSADSVVMVKADGTAVAVNSQTEPSVKTLNSDEYLRTFGYARFDIQQCKGAALGLPTSAVKLTLSNAQ